MSSSRWLFWSVAWMLSSLPLSLGELRGPLLQNIRGRRNRLRHSQGNQLPEDQIQTRIIGGSEVNPSDNRYPYFVSMRGVGICGGVLITPSIAISAAHCEPASDSVIVGMQSLSQISEYPSITIAEKVVHPLYGSLGYSYDAMIMKLATPSSEPYIMLNLNTSVPVEDQELWVLGFGDTAASERDQVLANVLNEVDVQYISNDVCATDYGQNLIHNDMLCAAGNGKDSCAGDSGGPLIVKGDSPIEDVLVGTVAWGIGCADARYPGVYSRTSAFVSWIQEQVCLLAPDDAPEYMACNSIRADSTSVPTATESDGSSQSVQTIQFLGWNPQNRGVQLELCQGDCDHNEDCAGDLICSDALSDRALSQCQFDSNTSRKKIDVCINP